MLDRLEATVKSCGDLQPMLPMSSEIRCALFRARCRLCCPESAPLESRETVTETLVRINALIKIVKDLF